MEHIERMKTELKELSEKIEKLVAFLGKELVEPKFTDETQRTSLRCQLEYMKNYQRILEERIKYDSLKIQK